MAAGKKRGTGATNVEAALLQILDEGVPWLVEHHSRRNGQAHGRALVQARVGPRNCRVRCCVAVTAVRVGMAPLELAAVDARRATLETRPTYLDCTAASGVEA